MATSMFYESSTNAHRWTTSLEVMNETITSNSSSSQTSDSVPTLSKQDSPLNDQGTRVLFIVSMLLFCLGLVGNTMTVLIVAIKRLHSPTYVTIACLAVSDVMAASTRFAALLNYLFYDEISRRYVLGIFTLMFLHSANFHMVLLSYIRYKFIAKPLRSLTITCLKVIKLSAFIWILSLIVSGTYAMIQILVLNGKLSFYVGLYAEIGFASFTAGLPLLLVICFHIGKSISMCNTSKQNRGPVVKSTHVMSVMFSIIIMVYLMSYVYPIIYSTLQFKFKYSHFLFHLSLLVNNSINPFIYFAFSPPVLKLLSRLRNYFNEISPNAVSSTSIFGKRYDVQQESGPRHEDLEIADAATNEGRICTVTQEYVSAEQCPTEKFG
jgi:hypothetical protein